MKKIFAFAMALVSMAAVMTSCSKDDDMVNELNPANKPAVQQEERETLDNTRTIYFMANAGQTEYFNCEYRVEVGSQSINVNLENLTTTTEYSTTIKTKVDMAASNGMKAVVYAYEIPANLHGNVTVYPNLSVKDGVALGDEADFIIAAFPKGLGNGKLFLNGGIYTNKLNEYFAAHNELEVMTSNVK